MGARRLLCHLLVTAACVGALGLVDAAPAQAGCVGPEVSVDGQALQREGSTPTPERPRVAWAAGDRLAVRGAWFFDGCNDTVVTQSGLGCSAGRARPCARVSTQVRVSAVACDRSAGR